MNLYSDFDVAQFVVAVALVAELAFDCLDIVGHKADFRLELVVVEALANLLSA